MQSDAETKIHWATQIAMIRQRFMEALRAGETIDSLDPWLKSVPESMRGKLREELEACQAILCDSSMETDVLASDAAIASSSTGDGSFVISHGDRPPNPSAVHCCPTFQGLSQRAIDDLEANLVPQTFCAGTQLLQQGQPARGLHLILDGAVDIVDTSTGERIDCDGAGSVLGEMSLLTGTPCSADVVALTEVHALVLSTDGYSRLIDEHPELEIALSQLVSDRLGGRKHDALCGKTLGRYQPVRCISRGGMGVVYEAKPLDGGEHVALKMLRHRFIYDGQMQYRFDQEVQLLEQLDHPNIVRFREHFLAYRTRFLVLDLCDGSDLFRLLRSCGPMDEPTVRAILGQIAQGLSYAHRYGVIHRDLKPGNVLVDRDGRVRLTDFGLSKLIESEVPEGKAVGTPSYMPPEQFRSSQIGCESDWYSLGCLVYEMLTGEFLFNGETWMEMYDQKKRAKPSLTWPALPCSEELQQIVRNTLYPDPADRRLDLETIAGWSRNVPNLFPK